MNKTFQGGCLCGKVHFEFDELLPQVAHCHCSMCRKFHGAAYATIASVPRSKFRWTKGNVTAGVKARLFAAVLLNNWPIPVFGRRCSYTSSTSNKLHLLFDCHTFEVLVPGSARAQ